jgi:hypothetical protein
MKWKQKFMFILTIIIYLHKEKNSYSSKWLNHLQRSYGLSKMSIILGFGIVWGLTKGLQNLWIHVRTLPLTKLIDYTTLSPSYLPFPDFLGQVIYFCKPPCASLKTYFKPLQTFKSIMTYWHVLKNAWPKQSLQTFLQTQYPTTYNKFEWCSHNNKNKPFILQTCNNFLLQVTFFQ